MGGLARPHRPRLLSHLSVRFFLASTDPIAVSGAQCTDPILVAGAPCGSRSTHLFGRAKWGCERS